MAALGDDVRRLSNDVLASWLLEDFPYRIQLAKDFPILPLAGDQLRYATTGRLNPGVALGSCEAIPEDTKTPKDPNRSYALAQLATQFRVCYSSQDLFSSNANDQIEVQMALAVRSLLYKFWTLFEVGDRSVNPREFDGLNRLVDPANVLDLQGRPLRTVDLHWAKEKVRANDGRAVAAFTSSVGKIAMLEASYARGAHPRYHWEPVHTPCGCGKRESIPDWDGARLYVNDLNQVMRTKDLCGDPVPPDAVHASDPYELATDIWFFVLGPGHLHGIMPERSDNIVVRSTLLPNGSALVYHLTMPIALALGSAASLSVIKNAAIPPE